MNIKSIDDGYGDLKFSSHNFRGLIPSFVTPFKPKPIQEIKSDLEESTYISTIIEGSKYLVGDYASRLDPNIKWIGGNNKHQDSRFPILLKTGLARMATKPYEKIDTLVMGLPNKADTEERRSTLTSIAKGNHNIEVSYDGVDYKECHITVENVIIKKQPFGSLCYLVLDQNGELKDPKLASGFNVIVDIGARTLNVLTVDALMEQPDLTTHSNDGMFVAFHQIADYLERELGANIPDGKLPQIIKQRNIRNMDIGNVIDEVYKNHANNIISILDTLLVNTFGFVTSIIFTGGGSRLLQPYLQKYYKHMNTKFLDRFATAEGLRYYGVRQTNKRSSISVRIGSNE